MIFGVVTGLPVRFTDALAVEVDAHAAGYELTPTQAMALGEELIHKAARRVRDLKRQNAAMPRLAEAG